MSFNSIAFLAFFPIVTILYFVIPKNRRWILLLLASCYFYMAYIPAYILILFYLIAIDYVMGRAIESSHGKSRHFFLVVSIIANVGTLFFFKYFNFFNANVAAIAHLLNWNYSLFALQIALPLGLSFHTFQSLAYVIEVYKRRFPAEKHLGIYALYVMLFPQLVAGPIERPQELLPQLHDLNGFKESDVVTGLHIMTWGFFKKIVVADTLGSLVDTVYANPHGVTGASLVFAAVAFAFQLYGDFSGYSDIARGAAKVFGITLVNNFNIPFFSRSVADFWRRWHISLSSWFRDYFYQPLALAWARSSAFGISFALIVTFAVLGLWHGAAWTYVFFGTWFGVLMAIGAATKHYRTRIAEAIGITKLPHIYAILQGLTTFGLVCLGLVFFRSTSLGEAWYILTHMWTGWGNLLDKYFWTSGQFSGHIFDETDTLTVMVRLALLPLSTAVMLFGEYIEHKNHVNAWLAKHPFWLRWAAYYALIFWIIAFGYYGQRTFIYFQF